MAGGRAADPRIGLCHESCLGVGALPSCVLLVSAGRLCGRSSGICAVGRGREEEGEQRETGSVKVCKHEAVGQVGRAKVVLLAISYVRSVSATACVSGTC